MAHLVGAVPSLGLSGRWVLCHQCREERRRSEEEALERERLARQERRLQDRTEGVREILSRMGVTRKYLDVELDQFDPDPDAGALRAAEEFVEEFRSGGRPSLYLFSSRKDEPLAPGSGKTHLAVGVLRRLVLDPEIELKDLSFAFVPLMLLQIQATFKHPERSEEEMVERYAQPELLVWDDFGAEKLSDYAARTLYTILYKREGKSNIFTSNLSLAAIDARDRTGYSQRITSRIAGDSRIIRMTGPDRRLQRLNP